MRVRYLGYGQSVFKIGQIYEVLTIENGWYRIMNEEHEESLFPPHAFEVVEGDKQSVVLVVA